MANTEVGVRVPLQVADITGSIDLTEGVVFEPNRALLVGVYQDELSAYRARKEWLATLQEGFLLEQGEDLSFNIQATPDQTWFLLSCEFISATARYAFWRITRGQAPEEQYRIESAHVASVWERSTLCPDLKPARASSDDPTDAILAGLDTDLALESRSLIERIVGTTKGLFLKKPPTR